MGAYILDAWERVIFHAVVLSFVNLLAYGFIKQVMRGADLIVSSVGALGVSTVAETVTS